MRSARLIGRLGGYTLHSRYDSGELVQPAREAFWSKFEREVDPDSVLDPAVRARRAEMARKGRGMMESRREARGLAG